MLTRSALASAKRLYLATAAALILVVLAQPLNAQFRPSGSGSRNWTYPSQKLKTGEKAIRSVTLLPPTIIQQGCWGGIRLQAGPESESPEARTVVSDILTSAFKARGWEVDAVSLSDDALKSDDKLRSLVEYLRVRSGNLSEQMMNRPADTAHGRYSLGGEVAGLGRTGRTDALVVVRSALLPPSCGDHALYMDLLLVEPQSGEVLCFSLLERNSIRTLTSEKRVEEILKELKKIP
jgi:hypothetical protein